MLPAAFLIDKGKIDPSTFVVDANTGSLIPHYAAHYGNLKFIRYLERHYKDGGFPDLKDNYNCGMVHYCTRQGHLAILMYCAEILGHDLTNRDKFGYNALEYSLMYKRLNCFIYLLYNRSCKEINPALVENIASTLCQPPSPEEKKNPNSSYSVDGKGKITVSFKLIQILLREGEMSSVFGPVLLINAIKHSRIDIVEEIYERCFYLPRMAVRDSSTYDYV